MKDQNLRENRMIFKGEWENQMAENRLNKCQFEGQD